MLILENEKEIKETTRADAKNQNLLLPLIIFKMLIQEFKNSTMIIRIKRYI
jgi:hypothetical protein